LQLTNIIIIVAYFQPNFKFLPRNEVRVVYFINFVALTLVLMRQILLLTPVYVTLFWAITLNSGSQKYHNPRSFLGKFMIIAFIVYLSHFFYFYPLRSVYAFVDPFYQYASLLVFPLYYIYFRLLTTDNEFSLKTHFRYLVPSTLLFILYSIGIFFTDCDDFKLWLFDRKMDINSTGINYLKVIHILIRITFLVQVIAVLVGNSILIKKYGEAAQQYYSDIEDSSTNKVKVLNFSMIVTALASLIIAALGRSYFKNEIVSIALASVVFSTMLFIIGWLGDRQKSLNPSYEKMVLEHNFFEVPDMTKVIQNELVNKILYLFKDKKIYLNSALTIQNIAQAVGTNRTYVSTIINQHFDQNFCTFVNSFRIDELTEVVIQHPEYTNLEFAESCGFGSIDSMKRAITAKTGMTFQEWKLETLQVEAG